jgi:protein SCO1/2
MIKYLRVFIIVIALSVLSFARADNIKIDGLYLTEPTEIADFSLINNQGKTFNKESMKGRWTMLFFGFVHCPMVCPATMAELDKMYKVLQNELPKDKLPQVVLISVDPERDTVSQLNEYVKTFNPNFIGARGDLSATESLEKQLHILAVKMHTERKNYTVNHSAEILLFNPDVKLQALLSYPHHAEQMIKDYKLIVGS